MNKGKLTIFTSYTPGAGKSYLMISKAMEAQSAGAKVEIGFINESHRNSGALEDNILSLGIAGENSYKKYSLKRLIESEPELVIMDEMGMGGKNRDKKSFVYEDIEELLGMGIDVYTTSNLKRFREVNPLFKEISGIGIKKTIPDRFLDIADNIYFLDREPELMIRDFDEGKLFDDGYMDSKIMRKNFTPHILQEYRQISLDYLNDKYANKTYIVKRDK